MSKYIHPRSRVSEDEKRRQRLLRFKNPQIKPTDYGFVSRGEDSRLQTSEQAQHEYFDWIQQNFDPEPENSERRREELGLKDGNEEESTERNGKAKDNAKAQSLSKHTDSESRTDRKDTGEKHSTDLTLSSLRKLREALLHQKPNEFSVKVHLFSVRASTPVGHYQTYVPSINYLLMNSDLLSDSEVKEIATLLVLHVSHYNNANEQAFRLFHQYLLRDVDTNVYSVLQAWVTGNYTFWLTIYNLETDHSIHAIMKGGLKRMLTHMVDCMTKSYFTMSVSEFDKVYLPMGMSRKEFFKLYADKWEEEEKSVVMRRRGKK